MSKSLILPAVLGIVIGVSGFYMFKPSKPVAKSAQDTCVEQAMSSDSKRKTAEMTLALHFQNTDQAHLIKYINTRDAVKAVYCK